ncbi:MAG: threonine ammonia-lyase [Clostridiales bacterium]|nr:threonine ammonia-lyase [Clostridiales bacterium]MCF8021564.1 threonine ammonia-lyase [Clostridiales bacterium]
MSENFLQKAQQAADMLSGIVHRTPLDYSSTFSQLTGSNVYLKLENLQKTGSFKVRGAYNALANLSSEEKQNGVIAASAGNHAQGVAWTASRLGMEATIVMPENAPLSKIMATSAYGAQVLQAEGGYDEAYSRAVSMQKEKGTVYIHSFDDYNIMAGQGTIGLEVLNQLPDADIVLIPVGGGGLISGIAGVIKQLKPGVKVVGVQAKSASAMQESKATQKLKESAVKSTIADGIAVGKPGKKTFDIISNYVDDIVTVDEEDITHSILLLLERSKIVVEGAGAVGLAALLQKKVDFPGKNVVAIISGGNIDMNVISTMIKRGLIKDGRRIRLSCTLEDRPGNLQKLLEEISRCRGNVISINHDRASPRVPLKQAEVELVLETRNKEHVQEIKNVLIDKGYLK